MSVGQKRVQLGAPLDNVFFPPHRSFTANAKAVSRRLRDTPRPPHQQVSAPWELPLIGNLVLQPFPTPHQAADWVEYVMRHGADHLKVPSVFQPWYVQNSLDVVLFLVGALAAVVALLVLCCRACCRAVRGGKQKMH